MKSLERDTWRTILESGNCRKETIVKLDKLVMDDGDDGDIRYHLCKYPLSLCNEPHLEKLIKDGVKLSHKLTNAHIERLNSFTHHQQSIDMSNDIDLDLLNNKLLIIVYPVLSPLIDATITPLGLVVHGEFNRDLHKSDVQLSEMLNGKGYLTPRQQQLIVWAWSNLSHNHQPKASEIMENDLTIAEIDTSDAAVDYMTTLALALDMTAESRLALLEFAKSGVLGTAVTIDKYSIGTINYLTYNGLIKIVKSIDRNILLIVPDYGRRVAGYIAEIS